MPSDFFFGGEPETAGAETPSDQTPASAEATASNDDGNDASSDEMTAPEEPALTDLAGLPWDEAAGRLQTQFPDKSLGILFCVHKLLADKEARLADFRGEAEVRGIDLSGRSIHSAKVLLGYAAPSVRKSKKTEPKAERREAAPTVARPRARSKAAPAAVSTSPSAALAVAIEQIQAAARAEAESLKDAIRDAIAILQDALDD